MTPEMGRAEDVAKKIGSSSSSAACMNEPLGVDVVEPPILFALQREGITVVDGQQILSDAREIKTQDEISLLTHSADDGRRRVPRALHGDEAGHARERGRRPGQQESVRRRARSTSKA